MSIPKVTTYRASLLLVAATASWSVAAQTLPPTADRDLLLPPALRDGAPAPLPQTGVSPRSARSAARAKVTARDGQPKPAPAHRSAEPEHPVDVGVVMRGGSSTPRLYSPSGTTQAVQESGSAFGAGMRIGF